MTRFRPGPQLDERVAARWAVPEVRRLADQLADRIRVNVPDAGVWITAQDERVRPTHVEADGQAIPNNLRYILNRADHNGQEMARAPRDPGLHIANRVNCRCLGADWPGAIAEHVRAGDVITRGARAAATVSVSFNRIVESEHPGSQDGGGGWLRRSIQEVAAARARSR